MIEDNLPSSKAKSNIVGIAGSPRRDGNTDLLLQETMRGAESKGAKAKFIILSELNIVPCHSCDQCLKDGRCVITDDMSWIYTELQEVELLVLASPIFFMGVTAQTKTMIDRCQCLWVLKYILHPCRLSDVGQPTTIKRKRLGAFLSTGGSDNPDVFDGALKTVKSWFVTLDISYFGSLLFPGISKKGSIIKHPTALQEAFALGQRLAEYSPEA